MGKTLFRWPKTNNVLLFEPRDLWVGIHWRTHYSDRPGWLLEVYVCIIPMLPLRFWIKRGR